MNPYYELVFDYEERLSDCEHQNFSSNVVIFSRSLLCDTSSLQKLVYFLFTIYCYDFFSEIRRTEVRIQMNFVKISSNCEGKRQIQPSIQSKDGSQQLD
jgi:hypothetical protein